jgi:hypothetical protein
MKQKSISLQITVLFAFATALVRFFFVNFSLEKGVLNALIITIKPYLLFIGILFFIPPFVNLIYQIFSKDNQKYDENPYRRVAKFILHLSFIVIGLYLLGFLWAMMAIGVFIISNKPSLLIIPSLNVFILTYVIDALSIKYFNRHWYNLKY